MVDPAPVSTTPATPREAEVPSRSRWSSRRAGALLAALAAFVTLGCWSVSSPPGSSPDENYHLASIWCAQGNDAGRCLDTDDPKVKKVPRQVGAAQCFVADATTGAECRKPNMDKAHPAPRMDSDFGNWAGAYPPVFYRVMNTMIGTTVDSSVITMRLFNSALAVAMIGGLAWLLPRRLRGVPLLTFLATSVPLSLFLVASVNPSGWAIVSTGVLWLALYGAFEASGARRIGLVGLAMLAAVTGAGARADAALFVIIGTALALGLRLAWWRKEWRLTLAALVLPLIGAAFYLSSGHASAVVDGMVGYSTTATRSESFFSNFLSIPVLWTSALGQGVMSKLGWFDTPMPPLVGLTSLLACASLMFQGWRMVWWNKVVAMLVIALAMLVYPLVMLQQSHTLVGQGMQPRYILPLLVILVGISLLPSPGTRFTLNRTQVIMLAVALTVGQSVALYANLWRYVRGVTTPFAWITSHTWWWDGLPLSPLAVWLIGSVAFAVLAWWILSRTLLESSTFVADPSEDAAPSDNPDNADNADNTGHPDRSAPAPAPLDAPASGPERATSPASAPA